MSRLWWFFLLSLFLESPLSATSFLESQPISVENWVGNGMTKSVQTKTVESANQVYVRRASKVLVVSHKKPSEPPADQAYVASFVKNLESVGYSASQELVQACSQLTLAELTELNGDVLTALKLARGAHLEFKPMYPNFPKQVMDMSEARLYLNAFVHYITDGKLLPASEKQPRPELKDKVELKALNLGTQQEFERIFMRLVGSNTSISQQDKDDVAWFIAHYGDDIDLLVPPMIPHRETKAFVCAQLIRHTSKARQRVPALCDTPTDILRLAVALSDGDVSLAAVTKFRNFSRPERRMLLTTLEAQKNLTEDMLRWKGRWIRLGERLHPREMKARFPKSAEAFGILRNDVNVETFNSKLESALEHKDISEIIALLKSRPGEFARRLDHVLRLSDEDEADLVVAEFDKVASKVSTPLLLQLVQHFKTRNEPREFRVFLPKGQVAKAQSIPNKLPKLDPSVCEFAVSVCTKPLVDKFKILPRLGKCYVDPELKNFLVPFSQRSASKSLRTATRGSRLRLSDADTLRFFIWWKNGRGRADLDLSAVMFKEDFTYHSVVAFYNLKDIGGHHSGDIVDAPNGASEFIDVSRKRCIEAGARYVAMVVSSYSGQPYCDLPECFAGWMAREKPNSGEIYDPRTVQDKLDLSANSKIAIPAVFDLKDGQVIWADLSLTQWPFWYNTVAANLWGIQLMLKSMLNLNKPNLYDLFKMHAELRGEIVADEKDADKVFSVAKGTPFELTMIGTELL